MPKVVIDLDDDTRLKLIAAAKGLGLRGISSKKKRIKRKVVAKAMQSIIEHAIRNKLKGVKGEKI